MGRIKPFIQPALLLIPLAVLAARLLYVVFTTETGFETIARQAQDALPDWLGLKHEPVDTWEPAAQAEFWLAETDRILAAEPDSAELAMGAAWVLDAPSPGFKSRYLRQREFAKVFPSLGVELDETGIETAELQFEKACRKRCLALPQRATDLEPDDVRWWRMRALLQFKGPFEFNPRHDAVLDVLDECAARDPDNALYDYLAASVLWDRGADSDWDTQANHSVLIIRDAEEFARGNERFARGLQRPFLAVGEDGDSAIARFVARARTSRLDGAQVVLSRVTVDRLTLLVIGPLRDWLRLQEEHAQQVGDAAQRAKILLQRFRLFEQVTASPEMAASNALPLLRYTYPYHAGELQAVAAEHPDLVAAEELARNASRERELMVKAAVFEEAFKKLEQAKPAEEKTSVLGFISAIAIVGAAAMLLAAAVFWLVALVLRRKTRDNASRLGLVRHALAWTAGCGLTFVAVGLGPAEVVSRRVQGWVIIGFAWAVALAIALGITWVVYHFMRRRKFQFSLLSVFVVTSACAAIVSLWPVLRCVAATLEVHPPEVWLAARGWQGIDAEVLRAALQMPKGSWPWALIQWFAYDGVYVGLIASLLLVALWFARRSARAASSGFFTYWTSDLRSRYGAMLRCLARSAAVAGALCLMLYLYGAPELVREVEARFQWNRDVAAHRAEVAAAMEQIRQSPRMRLIEAEVDAQLKLESTGDIE